MSYADLDQWERQREKFRNAPTEGLSIGGQYFASANAEFKGITADTPADLEALLEEYSGLTTVVRNTSEGAVNITAPVVGGVRIRILTLSGDRAQMVSLPKGDIAAWTLIESGGNWELWEIPQSDGVEPSITNENKFMGADLTPVDNNTVVSDSEEIIGLSTERYEPMRAQKLDINNAGTYAHTPINGGRLEFEIWCKTTSDRLVIAFNGSGDSLARVWKPLDATVIDSVAVPNDTNASWETIETSTSPEGGYFLKFAITTRVGGQLRFGSYGPDWVGAVLPASYDLGIVPERYDKRRGMTALSAAYSTKKVRVVSQSWEPETPIDFASNGRIPTSIDFTRGDFVEIEIEDDYNTNETFADTNPISLVRRDKLVSPNGRGLYIWLLDTQYLRLRVAIDDAANGVLTCTTEQSRSTRLVSIKVLTEQYLRVNIPEGQVACESYAVRLLGDRTFSGGGNLAEGLTGITGDHIIDIPNGKRLTSIDVQPASIRHTHKANGQVSLLNPIGSGIKTATITPTIQDDPDPSDIIIEAYEFTMPNVQTSLRDFTLPNHLDHLANGYYMGSIDVAVKYAGATSAYTNVATASSSDNNFSVRPIVEDTTGDLLLYNIGGSIRNDPAKLTITYIKPQPLPPA